MLTLAMRASVSRVRHRPRQSAEAPGFPDGGHQNVLSRAYETAGPDVLTHCHESEILQAMTKRLQVLLDEDELAEIQAAARARRVTVADWVRGALRAAREDPPATAERKLATLRRATRHEFPTADIDAMITDIEAGYAEEAAPGRGKRQRTAPSA